MGKAARDGVKTGAADKLLSPLLSPVTAYGSVVNDPRKAIHRRADGTGSIDPELRRLRAIHDEELHKLIVKFERLLQKVMKDLGAKECRIVPRNKDKGAGLLAPIWSRSPFNNSSQNTGSLIPR